MALNDDNNMSFETLNNTVIDISEYIEQQKKDLDKIYGDKIIELCKNNPNNKIYENINSIYQDVYGNIKKNINYIDILHSDIQGYEFLMLDQMNAYFEQKKINYVFISTHTDELHYQCINFLTKKDYMIICIAYFTKQTFHFDGFILACPSENIEIKSFEIGNRNKSFLISDTDYNNLKSEFLK